jgi:putative hemolysin
MGHRDSVASAQPSMDAIEWFRAEFQQRFWILGTAAPVIYKWLFGSAEKAYHRLLQSEGPIIPAALRSLRLGYQCSPEDLLRIPRTGPVILVANHPYGEVEGLLLGASLAGIRRDFKLLATSAVASIPPLREFLIPIDRRLGLGPLEANLGSIRAAVQWLRSGGLVIVFPAGTTATRPFPKFKLTEQPWTDIAALLARWSDAAIAPVFFHGCNHWMFYAASLLHSELRYVVLIWQMLRRKRCTIRMSIGTPIRPQAFIEQAGLKRATEHLRSRTLDLSEL